MNFDFLEDWQLPRQTARSFPEDRPSPNVRRAALESDRPRLPELWKSAAELASLGDSIPDEQSGAAAGHLEPAVPVQLGIPAGEER